MAVLSHSWIPLAGSRVSCSCCCARLRSKCKRPAAKVTVWEVLRAQANHLVDLLLQKWGWIEFLRYLVVLSQRYPYALWLVTRLRPADSTGRNMCCDLSATNAVHLLKRFKCISEIEEHWTGCHSDWVSIVNSVASEFQIFLRTPAAEDLFLCFAAPWPIWRSAMA